jgi:hypothetical protein
MAWLAGLYYWQLQAKTPGGCGRFHGLGKTFAVGSSNKPDAFIVKYY